MWLTSFWGPIVSSNTHLSMCRYDFPEMKREGYNRFFEMGSYPKKEGRSVKGSGSRKCLKYK